jgi:type I restriction enzyme M protein
VLTNRKAPERKGKVQLIDATSFGAPVRKSLGDKRREIPPEKAAEVLKLFHVFEEGEHSRIYPTTHFGYRKITAERPLRLNFRATHDRIARLDDESAFKNLDVSKKKDASAKEAGEAAGRVQQDAIRKMLATLPATRFTDREMFLTAFKAATKAQHITVPAPIQKAILSALSERDETAEICRDKDGRPEPEPEWRDTENVPLSACIESYFARTVAPDVPEAWINTGIRDQKDGQVGKVDYEINFNRCVSKYTPPRPLEEIEADIRAIEKDIVQLLREI